ncbi:large-conductance mechanosensitive channel [Chytriomyces cf. hyalinus JEL632]|nr:large-conductance mechanosensitive channel [Chytriomyces cf. hyalinus JEL632]
MDSLQNRLPPTFTPVPTTETVDAVVPPSIVPVPVPVPANKLKKMASNVTSNISKGALKTVGASMSVGEAFIAFINRGSVIDLAIGVVMGAAFTAIVTSFVTDLVTPVIGLATQKNLGNLFLVIKCPPNNGTSRCVTGSDHPYGTFVQANGEGAATWNYGNFIQTCINFILISIAMFLLVQLYSKAFLSKKVAPPATKPCAECAEPCPLAAKKCRCCLTAFPVVVEDEIAPSAEPNAFEKMFHKPAFLKA